MSKHTPGPWKFHRADEDTLMCRGVDGGEYVTQIKLGAHALDGISDKANARLIASAPELLKALQDYVSDWDNGLGPDIARLRAAIAKAGDAS